MNAPGTHKRTWLVRRREFITLGASVLCCPSSLFAQQSQLPTLISGCQFSARADSVDVCAAVDWGSEDRFLSGHASVDAGISTVFDKLVNLFEVEPPVVGFGDGTANAMALNKKTHPVTNERVGPTRLCLGRGLVTALPKRKFNLSEIGPSLTGIMAHEFAHLRQYKDGLDSILVTDTHREIELHADFLSGWALPQCPWITTFSHLGAAVQKFFEIGDDDNTNPQHHGTPEERRAVFGSGLALGLTARSDARARSVSLAVEEAMGVIDGLRG